MFLIYHETRKLYLTNPKLNAPMFSPNRKLAYEFPSREFAEAVYNDNRLWRADVMAEKHLLKIIEEKEAK